MYKKILNKQYGGLESFKSMIIRTYGNPNSPLLHYLGINSLNEAEEIVVDLNIEWGKKETRSSPPPYWTLSPDIVITRRGDQREILGILYLAGLAQYKEEPRLPNDLMFRMMETKKFGNDFGISGAFVLPKALGSNDESLSKDQLNDQNIRTFNYDWLTFGPDAPIQLEFTDSLDPLIFRLSWSSFITETIWKHNQEGRISKGILIYMIPIFQSKLKEIAYAWNTQFGTQIELNKPLNGTELWMKIIQTWDKQHTIFKSYEEFHFTWMKFIARILDGFMSQITKLLTRS